MLISIIVAMDENQGIGFENHLPWRLSEDLKRFKRLTLGHHLIVGRKTFESIGRTLTGRQLIVLTRNQNFDFEGVDVVSSLDAAIGLAKRRTDNEIFVGGGAQIYRLALPITNRIYLTRVQARIQADVFFPELDFSEWIEISSEQFGADAKNQYSAMYTVLEKGSVNAK